MAKTYNAYYLNAQLINAIKNNADENAIQILPILDHTPLPGGPAALHLPLDEETAKQLGDAIAQNTTLLEIDFSNMDLAKPVAFYYLLEGIQKNRTLRVLHFDSCKIDDMGAKYLAKALTDNTNLQEITLAANDISERGAAWLANALSLNKILDKLTLERNQINAAERFFQHRRTSINPGFQRDLPYGSLTNIKARLSIIVEISTRVMPILDAEVLRLHRSGNDTGVCQRVALMKGMMSTINDLTQNYDNSSPENEAALKRSVEKVIQDNLLNNNLDKYRDWRKELGLTLLNVLCAITLVTPLLKYAITGSCFFSTKGKTQEAATAALVEIQNMNLKRPQEIRNI